MMIPTVHLNGTSRSELLRQFRDAYAALITATDKLAQASPNARDYYPQGDDAYGKARDEHIARMRKLKEVTADLEEIAAAILPPAKKN